MVAEESLYCRGNFFERSGAFCPKFHRFYLVREENSSEGDDMASMTRRCRDIPGTYARSKHKPEAWQIDLPEVLGVGGARRRQLGFSRPAISGSNTRALLSGNGAAFFWWRPLHVSPLNRPRRPLSEGFDPQLLGRAACQLPDQTDYCLGGTFLHW
jgi:hypothetical protein